MYMKRFFVLAFVLVALGLTFHEPVRADESALPAGVFGPRIYLPLLGNPTGSQDLQQQSMAQQVLTLINQRRATAGCGPLSLNANLADAAQQQSTDMALNDFFSHTNPDPARATLSQRADAVGYNWSYLGENIAAGYTTPAAAVAGWIASPGHLANIENCAFTETGIGYYYQADDQALPTGGGPYYHYWTQVFGRP